MCSYTLHVGHIVEGHYMTCELTVVDGCPTLLVRDCAPTPALAFPVSRWLREEVFGEALSVAWTPRSLPPWDCADCPTASCQEGV